MARKGTCEAVLILSDTGFVEVLDSGEGGVKDTPSVIVRLPQVQLVELRVQFGVQPWVKVT